MNRRRVSVFFAWFDFWVGAYFDRADGVLYVCPLPCVVVRVVVRKPRWNPARDRDRKTVNALAGLAIRYRSIDLSYSPGPKPWGIVASVTNGKDGTPRPNFGRGASLSEVADAAILIAIADPALPVLSSGLGTMERGTE